MQGIKEKPGKIKEYNFEHRTSNPPLQMCRALSGGNALLENANYLQNMLTVNVSMVKIASDLHFLYQNVEECMMEYKMSNLRSGDS